MTKLLNNLRLLIVDDDEEDTDLFIEAVEEVDEGIACNTAKNGLAALEWLRDSRHTLPDLIFLDISMPLLNGKKCLEEIKRDDRLKEIPVIIYTTSRDVEESKLLKEMGAFHFISKPANADEIYYLVAVTLEEHLLTTQHKH